MTTPTNSGTNAGGQGNPGSGTAGAAPTPGQVFPHGSGGGTGAQGGQQPQGGQQQAGDGSGDGNLTPEEMLGQLLGDNTGQGGQGQGQNQVPDLSDLPETVQAYVRAQTERANALQRRARELEKARNKGAAAERRLQELEDANKSELEKAQAAAARAEEARRDAESQTYRLLAAASNDLSPDMIEFLGSGTEAEINDRAAALQTAIKAEAAKLVQSLTGGEQNGQQQQFSRRRPVETLRAGGAPASSNGGQTAEDAFRGMLAQATGRQ